ncbi:MAG: hypothetical protein CML24_14645 [Rhizobiales bacterium]|nr:hypothetical protein [Hyphomicrobiales bacterium]|tara:strand:+ start:4366 stop:4548 length:183 start_codon:yes stop_codon:yes gene_type:complete
MIAEVRMTLRLPREAAVFLDSIARKNFTSRNAEIVRCIREQMKTAPGGEIAAKTPDAVEP